MQCISTKYDIVQNHIYLSNYTSILFCTIIAIAKLRVFVHVGHYKVTGNNSSQQTSPLLELACYIGSHNVIGHPAKVAFPPWETSNSFTAMSADIHTGTHTKSQMPLITLAIHRLLPVCVTKSRMNTVCH